VNVSPSPAAAAVDLPNRPQVLARTRLRANPELHRLRRLDVDVGRRRLGEDEIRRARRSHAHDPRASLGAVARGDRDLDPAAANVSRTGQVRPGGPVPAGAPSTVQP
jgi:hypothetical protein